MKRNYRYITGAFIKGAFIKLAAADVTAANLAKFFLFPKKLAKI